MRIFLQISLIFMIAMQAVFGAFCQLRVAAAAPVVGDEVVISQVQVGNKSSSRLIELYNNSADEIDITNWCVRYTAAASTPGLSSGSIRACFQPVALPTHMIFPAHSYMLIAASELGVAGDFHMANEGLGGGDAGKVYVTDAQGEIIDLFAWGEGTVQAEGEPFVGQDSSARIFERKFGTDDKYQDTDNNSEDFVTSTLRETYSVGAIYEVEDVCNNLAGLQITVPEGSMQNDDGSCAVEPIDICENIVGVQTELPPGMEVDSNNLCYQDACFNLPGFQNTVPAGFTSNDQGICYADIPPTINEILANPDGDDQGSEFIEIYNPSGYNYDMRYFDIVINGDTKKPLLLTDDMSIVPGGYGLLMNNTLDFTLTNSGGDLSLRLRGSESLGEPVAYLNAPSGRAWAKIGNEWQYVSTPSPGQVNIADEEVTGEPATSILADCGVGRERNPLTNRCRAVVVATSLMPCASGEYRNPETNRCRNIASSNLIPCKEGQYRSEETNRCRSILSANSSDLKPCAEDQFRNPLTNRCKKIASTDDLADCGEGRERNPETNRCRNVLSLAKSSDFPVEPVGDTTEAFIGWWALGGVGLLALGYAGWEWRHEIVGFVRKLSPFAKSAR